MVSKPFLNISSVAAHTSLNKHSTHSGGNVNILAEIASTLSTFQIGFEILPGTAPAQADNDLNPYAVAEDSVFVSGE